MADFKYTFQMLFFFFKPHKKLLILYLISLIIFSGLDVFRVYLIYPIVNYGLDLNSNLPFFNTIFQIIFPEGLNPFIASAILLAIVTIIMVFFELFVAYLASKTFASVRDTTDRSVFRILKNQPYEYFASQKQGDLLYIGQVAVNQTGDAVNNFVSFIQNLLLCLFYLSFIFILSFKISIIILVIGAFFTLLIKKIVIKKIYGHGKILNDIEKSKSVIYNEFLSGIKAILITDSIKFWSDKYDTAVKKLLKSYTIVKILQRIPTIINNFLIFILIAIGAVGLYIITNGDFLPYVGIFGTYMLALYRMVPALNGCQKQYGAITQSLPAIESVYNLLKEKEFSDENAKMVPEKTKGMSNFHFNNRISFGDVYFRYKKDLGYTIRGLSFDIKKNSKVAIVGNSGAGKTTIANLLALLYKPSSGEILIDGINIHDLNKSDYLKTLGYLGQETFIYHDTIKENIKFGLEYNDDEIIKAAKLADAHDFIIAMPEGYETIIGDQGMKLSGGQRQRVAIARIMLRKPEILLLDEATSSLDNISEQKVMDSVDRLSKNMTVIIIAHRLSTVQNADVIYLLNEGRISESGTHEQLMEAHGEYYKLYTKQKSS